MGYFDYGFYAFLVVLLIVAIMRNKEYQKHIDEITSLAKETNDILREIRDLLKNSK